MFLSQAAFKSHYYKAYTDRNMYTNEHTPVLGFPAVAFRCLGMPGYAFSLLLHGFNNYL